MKLPTPLGCTVMSSANGANGNKTLARSPLTTQSLATTFLCSYNTPSIIQDAYRLYPAEPEGHWRTS